ncbi:hypothetical protein ACFP65_03510 [Marinilactibacillus sp. GCM10026970]|uniref:hypothetical protein n=1 Tax=Marinilactibacillus sp. GCM10026970 TaxID=3252642 RepID=UPI003606292B
MWWIYLPIIVGVILAIVLPIIYRNHKKTDKGFQFVYYGLSYRRKFIRTLWIAPLIVLSIWIILYSDVWSQSVSIALVTIGVIGYFAQLGYNYYKMKQAENT